MKFVTPWLLAAFLIGLTIDVLAFYLRDPPLALSTFADYSIAPLGFSVVLITAVVASFIATFSARHLDATPIYMAYAGAVFGAALGACLATLWSVWQLQHQGLL
jgi:uncharacterized membrane protein